MPIKSIHLQENEEVLIVLHRHWFVLVREFASVIFLIILGVIVFSVHDMYYSFLRADFIAPLAVFLLTLYLLTVLALSFAIWINYRLDVWIVTTRRIIDVEQRSLFNREISEFLIGRVQDVTTEVPNMVATLLDFGNITLQTAGHKNFYVREVPHLEETKKLILEYSHKARTGEIHNKM
jgi:hypothetical protein